MGRGPRGNGHQTARRPVELTGIVSYAEWDEFSTLINNIIDSMQKNVISIFDTPVPVCSDSEQQQHRHVSIPLNPIESNKENASALNHLRGRAPDEASTAMPENITHHQAVDGEKRATASTYMELKKEALVYFGKWQAGVLQRLREVKVSYADNGAQRSRGRGRRLRPGSRAGRSGQGGRGCLMPSTLATGKEDYFASSSPPPQTPSVVLSLDAVKIIAQADHV